MVIRTLISYRMFRRNGYIRWIPNLGFVYKQMWGFVLMDCKCTVKAGYRDLNGCLKHRRIFGNSSRMKEEQFLRMLISGGCM